MKEKRLFLDFSGPNPPPVTFYIECCCPKSTYLLPIQRYVMPIKQDAAITQVMKDIVCTTNYVKFLPFERS